MNTQVINARENRSQMIMKIQNKLDELGFERFLLCPYDYSLADVDDNDDSELKRFAIRDYIRENLADYESLEYCYDWFFEDEDEYIEPTKPIDDEFRYPFDMSHHYVDYDTQNEVGVKLIEIKNGQLRGNVEYQRYGCSTPFSLPFDDILCAVGWDDLDENLIFYWGWINDPRMIKFNELVNKPNEYFEKDTNK